jgi:tetratricopeptide (TPR) repeat protein
MQLGRQEAEDAIRAGIIALQRSDGAEAQRLLEQLIDRGSPLPPPWFLLAQACRQTGDREAEAAALDRLLADQPRHIGALIMRGDLYDGAADERAAVCYYKRALTAAAEAPQVSPLLQAEVARAEARCRAYQQLFQAQIEKKLAEVGTKASRCGSRFQDAIDIMLGRKQIYLQQPTSFYYPGLPQIEYYEREAFDWVPAVEAATDAIRRELIAVLEGEEAFVPYVETDPDRPPSYHRLAGNPDWGAFHLWRGGAPVAGNADRCPATMAALEQAPLPRIRGRSPMALFSRLRPGTFLTPHTGMINTRLICHLPLIVPPDCALRVGNQVRSWEEGRMLIFDDTIEHEAWNRSGEARVILLFEIWRPELSADEREALTAMYEAITDYGFPTEE